MRAGWTCFGLLLLLVACHTDEGDADKILIGVQDDLLLDMVQYPGPKGLDFQLSFRSQTNYACDGAGFTYTLRTSPDDIGIHLTSISVPQPCAGGNSPAVELIGMPVAPGTYTLDIHIGDLIHNTGILESDSLGYHLFMNELHGISLTHQEMFRIPERTIWGYVYHPSQQALADSIAQSLLQSYAHVPGLAPGYYGCFQIQEENKVTMFQPLAHIGGHGFVYQWHLESRDIPAIAVEIVSACPPGTTIRVLAWDGTEF